MQLSENEFGQEHSEYHGSCEKDKQHRHERGDCQAAALPGSRRVLQMLLQQSHVPVVRFPRDIEDISEQRNPADRSVERDVRQHSADNRSRCTQPGSLKDEISREHRAYQIAQAGNQADQGIQSKPIVGPRYDKGAIEQPAQCPEVLDLGRLMSAEDRWLGARSRVLAHL